MERYFDRIKNDHIMMDKWKRVRDIRDLNIDPFGKDMTKLI